MNNKDTINYIFIGAILSALYVALGAFGTHGLKEHLTISQVETYNTGLRYLIIHATGLILMNGIYILLHKHNKWSNYMTVIGITLFSISLIIHSLKDLIGMETNFFAMLAPLGGLSYIAAWLLFGFTIYKK